MYFFYNLLFGVTFLIFFTLSAFSEKLRKNLSIRLRLSNDLKDLEAKGKKPRYWFHASSVGEYEQIYPIIRKVKARKKEAEIFVSVFSYSAYSQCKKNSPAKFFFAMPFDFYISIKKILKKIQPDFIIYSRYDVWPNLVKQASRQGVKQILISATLSDKSIRNVSLFTYFFKKVYSFLDRIYTIDSWHGCRFEKLGLIAEAMGDTRYDAISERLAESPKPSKIGDLLNTLRKYASGKEKRILVGGSTYLAAEENLIKLVSRRKNIFLVLAPHHVDKTHIQKLEQRMKQESLGYLKYSDWLSNRKLSDIDIFLVDSVGFLLHLYKIADVSYVGGGFKGSVHSVIEPAFLKVPTITGPQIKNSQDALDLKKIGLVHILSKNIYNEWEKVYASVLQINERKHKLNELVDSYIQKKMNAAEKIMRDMEDL